MSKSTGNYIGVTDAPEDMFGKVMSVPDDTTADYWRLLLGQEPPDEAPNLAKRALGRALVARFHGERAAVTAEEHFDRVFVHHEAPEEIEDHRMAGDPVHLPAELAGAFGISRSEARRVLYQGGVRRDGEVLPPAPLDYGAADLSGCVLQLGKRRFKRFVSG